MGKEHLRDVRCLLTLHQQNPGIGGRGGQTGQIVQWAWLRQGLPYPLGTTRAVLPEAQRQNDFTLWRFKAGHIAKGATLAVGIAPQGRGLPMLCMLARRLRRGIRYWQDDAERGGLA